MIKEDKQLLFKDLCARLPYNLYIRVEEFNVPENDGRITEGFIGNYLKDNRCNDYDTEEILNEFADGLIDIKPYLRPISSLTSDECDRLFEILNINDGDGDYLKINDINIVRLFTENGKDFYEIAEAMDYLYSIHIDFRGLIELGLALEAPKGMYKKD